MLGCKRYTFTGCLQIKPALFMKELCKIMLILTLDGRGLSSEPKNISKSNES